MREYQILMGKDQLDLWNALIEHQYKPTKETEERLNILAASNEKRLIESQESAEKEFIMAHTQPMLELVKSISDKYFLVGQHSPFYLTWNISSDDSDNYYSVKFWKGRFDYVEDIAGGYGGTNTLEENISYWRLMELINSKK